MIRVSARKGKPCHKSFCLGHETYIFQKSSRRNGNVLHYVSIATGALLGVLILLILHTHAPHTPHARMETMHCAGEKISWLRSCLFVRSYAVGLKHLVGLFAWMRPAGILPLIQPAFSGQPSFPWDCHSWSSTHFCHHQGSQVLWTRNTSVFTFGQTLWLKHNSLFLTKVDALSRIFSWVLCKQECARNVRVGDNFLDFSGGHLLLYQSAAWTEGLARIRICCHRFRSVQCTLCRWRKLQQ